MPNFYDLPRELRDSIYEELLVYPCRHVVLDLYRRTRSDLVLRCFADDKTALHRYGTNQLLHPAILLANKKTYKEANALLYSKNRFIFYDTSTSVLGSFLDEIGPQNASFIRHLDISAVPFPDKAQAKLGIMALDEESSRTLDLIQDKCTNIVTLETTNYAMKYRIGSLTPKEASEFLTLVATRIEAISSLREFILHVYEEPVDHVKEKISAFGWHLKITERDAKD